MAIRALYGGWELIDLETSRASRGLQPLAFSAAPVNGQPRSSPTHSYPLPLISYANFGRLPPVLMPYSLSEKYNNAYLLGALSLAPTGVLTLDPN